MILDKLFLKYEGESNWLPFSHPKNKLPSKSSTLFGLIKPSFLAFSFMKKKNSTICRQIYRKQQLDCCSRVIWNYIRLHVQSATPRKVSTRIIFLRNLIWRFRIGVSVTCYLHCLTNNSACKELIKVNKEDVKEWIRTSAWCLSF